MENLTPVEICMVVAGVIMVIASAVNTIGAAAEKVAKAVRAAKAPNAVQDSRLDELEKWRVEVDQRLLSGNIHFEAIDEGNRVTQRALLALLSHGIDGNNVAQMERAKADLETHLINR